MLFLVPLRLFMFSSLSILATAHRRFLPYLADISLSGILNQCQFFFRALSKILLENTIAQHKNMNWVLSAGISQNHDMPRSWTQWIIAGSYLSYMDDHFYIWTSDSAAIHVFVMQKSKNSIAKIPVFTIPKCAIA
jgi:hypothetical protein